MPAWCPLTSLVPPAYSAVPHSCDWPPSSNTGGLRGIERLTDRLYDADVMLYVALKEEEIAAAGDSRIVMGTAATRAPAEIG